MQKHKMKIKTGKQKTKIKQNDQTKQNEMISPQKYHWVHFVLTNFSWAGGMPWTVAGIPRDIPLEKMDFPFARRLSSPDRTSCPLPLSVLTTKRKRTADLLTDVPSLQPGSLQFLLGLVRRMSLPNTCQHSTVEGRKVLGINCTVSSNISSSKNHP